jgi:hypothetical protein
MSFSIIYNFQRKIYDLLSNSPEIKLAINKIYLSPVQDAKYPFLLINILKVKIETISLIEIYEIEFEICIFVKDKNQALFGKLVNEISKILCSSWGVENYIIAGLRASEASFQTGQDLITSKLSVNYNALLKMKVSDEFS